MLYVRVIFTTVKKALIGWGRAQRAALFFYHFLYLRGVFFMMTSSHHACIFALFSRVKRRQAGRHSAGKIVCTFKARGVLDGVAGSVDRNGRAGTAIDSGSLLRNNNFLCAVIGTQVADRFSSIVRKAEAKFEGHAKFANRDCRMQISKAISQHDRALFRCIISGYPAL